jgi:polysaccharide deacetylase 2 family uncharacterized protein YibQ
VESRHPETWDHHHDRVLHIPIAPFSNAGSERGNLHAMDRSMDASMGKSVDYSLDASRSKSTGDGIAARDVEMTDV